MKLNLSLLIIFISLFGYSYFIDHEKIQAIEQIELNQRVLSTDKKSIFSLKLPYVHLIKKNDSWYFNNEAKGLVDKNKVDRLVELISNLKKVQVVKDELLSSGKNKEISIVINDNHIIKLGDVSKVTGRFYLKYNSKTYLAASGASFNDTYRSDFEKHAKQFIELDHYINAKVNFYIEQSPFYHIDFDDINSVRFDSFRNRWFEVNFVTKSMTPSIWEGLRYRNLKNTFINYAKQIKVEKPLMAKALDFSQKMSEVSLSVGDEKEKLNLYGLYKGESGYYLEIESKKRFYKLNSANRDLFFLNSQDFWRKRVSYNVSLSNLKAIDFKLGKNENNLYDFQIPDIKDFKVKSLNSKVDFSKSKMNFLFNLIFNLVDFKEAKYIEKLRDVNSKDYQLIVKILDKTFFIRTNKGLIELVESGNKLKFVFLYNDSLLGSDILNDVFTVVNN